MKKITSIILALIMILSSFAVLPMTVSAATESTTVVESKSVKVGDTFEVNITVANYANVAAITFIVPGTSDKLEFVEAVNNTTGPIFDNFDMGDGTYALSLAGNGVASALEATSGKPVTLKYKALAAGTANIAVTVSEMLQGATAEMYNATSGVITIAEDAPAEPIVYTGNAIQLSGTMIDGTPALNAAGNVEAAVKAGTGSDGTRISIQTAGAPKTMPHMVVAMKLTNANKTVDNFCPTWNNTKRLWSQSDATGGANQTFNATEITKHLADFSKHGGGEYGGFSSIGDSDKLTGATINAWNGSVGAGTVEVAYVAFFATRAEAEAYTGPATDAPAITPVALYTGEDITVTGEGYLASLTQEIVDGVVVLTLPEAAAGDTTRFSIKTAGAPKSAHYMAYGIMISDYNKTSDNTNPVASVNGGANNTRMWSGGAYSNQAYSKTEIQKQIIDFSAFGGGQPGGWSAVTDTDKVIGTFINAWTDTVTAGTTVKIQYVAFFNSLEDAANYVYEAGEGGGNEEETPANVIYAKDVPSYKLGAVYNGVTNYDGNTAIFPAYTEGHWDEWYDNDDCCIVTAKDLTISTANKYYVISMASFANKETNANYTPSTVDNVRFYVDGTATDYVDVDLASHNGTDLYAYVIDASALLTSGTNVTAIEFDPIPNTKKGGSGNTRYGKNGQFRLGFIATFETLAEAEAYAAEFNGGEEAPETVTVTFKVDGVQYGEPVELEKGAALVYPAVAPTKDGYTFTGWDVAAGTAINADTVVNAIFEEDEEIPEVTPVALYYGNDITVTGEGNIASLTQTIENGVVVLTLPGAAAGDTTRFSIKTEGAPKSAHYMAYGIMISDYNKASDNTNPAATVNGGEKQTRMWSGGAYSNQAYSKTEIQKQIIDFSAFGGGENGSWSAVTDTDKVLGTFINAWTGTVTAGTTVKIQYVAFFNSLEDAQAFVFDAEEAAKVEVTYMLDGQVIATQKYTPGEALVYPEVEAPKGYEITGWNVDEGTIVEDAMTVQAFFNEIELPLVEDDVLGKDLEITWGSYYSHKESHKVEVVGNNTVATASSDWQNDGCADFTIKNVPVDGKYLVLNIEASSNKAALATEDNITIGSLVLDADFTAGSQFVFDISDLGDIDTISSIKVRAFKAQGGQLENVKVVVGSVSTAPYAITLDGELVAVADEGALYELPVAVSDEAGMRFVGWTDGTDMYLAGTKIDITSDLVLTPEFEAATEWYVTYIVNGEVYEVVTVALDGEVAHPTAPAMEGYKFAGWYNEAGERVINGDAVTNDMTLTANFTEAGDDEEFLGTFLTILKMITAKKANGGSTAGGSQAGTTAASSTPVVVYTGEQITVKPQGSIASAEAAVNAAGNVEVALPAGTGADGTRIYIVTEGADMTTPFMAVGLKLTNATKAKDVFCPMVNGSRRFWSPSDADANGNNQTFSATAIVNHVVDFTGFKGGEVSGGWSGVTSSDVLTGVSVNAWTYDQAFAAGTMEIAYVAFFKTLDDAKAYVHGAVAEEAPAEEPKEEVKEEEPAVSAGAILGKDLEIEWGSYWTHAGNNPSISVVGNNTVATGDSNWQNDGCAIFTIKNVAIEKGAKTLVLNIKASSEGEAPARPSTANNIVITAGSSSKTYSFDFTNATEELTAIELDISNFKNVTKLDSIQLDVFANNKVETAVGNLYGVEVIIGAIECK